MFADNSTIILANMNMIYNEWQYGKKYDVAQDGCVMTRREHGVKLGTVRVFKHTDRLAYDTSVEYYAEREFPSLIPFRAPKIWWRRISE